MLIANHINFMDPMFIFSAFIPSPIAAREFLDNPLLAPVIRAVQTVVTHNILLYVLTGSFLATDPPGVLFQADLFRHVFTLLLVTSSCF